MEENPWESLSSKPNNNGEYILGIDEKIIKELEKQLDKQEKYKLHLKLLPEPFIGDPDAPVYLLNLNPGFDKNDLIKDMKRKEYIDCIRENHKMQKSREYPFYFLNPKLAGTGGSQWWKEGRQIKRKDGKKGKIPPRLGQLLIKYDAKFLSKNIFCVEYFPYHSKSYSKKMKVKSQDYNIDLIKKAIKDKKIFIIMRKEKELYLLIPELEKHRANGMVFSCSSKSNPCITEKNIGSDGFKKITNILNKKLHSYSISEVKMENAHTWSPELQNKTRETLKDSSRISAWGLLPKQSGIFKKARVAEDGKITNKQFGFMKVDNALAGKWIIDLEEGGAETFESIDDLIKAGWVLD